MQLARPRTPFIGRARELAEITGLLAGAPACVTLTGPGGAGKTRLATEVSSVRDDARWVELAGISDAAVVAQRAASVAGVGADDAAALADALAGTSGLLVLDNCEHLVGTAADTARAFVGAGWHVLATSRERLAIDGERTVEIPPLAHPDPREAPAVETLARYDAVALFVDRARTADPSFELTGANAPAIAQICAHLDGIPLALELAAARMQVLSPAQIAERLGDRFRLLTSSRRDADPRQRTLEATIAWGVDLLDERERALLVRMAQFGGRVDLETLEVACSDELLSAGAILDTVAALASKSLVVVDSGERAAYRLLDSVRAYAAAQIDDPQAWQARIIAWAGDVARGARDGLNGSEQSAWTARLDTLHDTMMHAIADAERLDPAAGLAIIGPLWVHWDDRGLGREIVAPLQRMLDAAPDAAPTLRIGGLTALGLILANVGDRERARRFADEAVALAESTGDPTLISKALNTAGSVTVRSGDIPGALTIFERAVETERRSGGGDLGSLVGNLATMCHEMRDLDRASELYEEAAGLFRAAGDVARLGMLTMNQGTLLHETGDVRGARACYEEALEIAVAMGNRRTQVLLAVNIGNAEQDLGDSAAALRSHRDAVVGAREIAFPYASAVAAQAILVVAAQRGDHAPLLRGQAVIERVSPDWILTDAVGDQTDTQRAVAEAALALGADETARIQRAAALMTLDDIMDEALAVADRLLGAAPAPAPTAQRPASGTFRRDGDTWEIAFGGAPFRLKDAKGLGYLAHLLARPDQDVHVADLVGATGIADDEGVRRRMGDAGEAIDPEAARAFAEKIRELEAEREEALSWSDGARADRLADEIERISVHLTSAYGLSGRARRTADPAERMRKAVTNRIRDALTRIGGEDPDLERYLRNTVRTGTFCTYRPDRAVLWDL